MSTKAFKNDKVAQIKSNIDKAQVAIVTNFTGFSVEEITKLITLADVLELKAGIEILKALRFFYDLILLRKLWLGG